MIIYDKFFALMKDKNIKTTEIRRCGIVSEATLQKMRHGNTGLSADSLNRICAYFECQPSDIMEYVEDEKTAAWLAEKKVKE